MKNEVFKFHFLINNFCFFLANVKKLYKFAQKIIAWETLK